VRRAGQAGERWPQAAREIAGSALLSTLAAPAAVALLFDYETQWMFEIQRHGKSFDYQTPAFDYYESQRELGLDVDSDKTLALVRFPPVHALRRNRHARLIGRHMRCVGAVDLFDDRIDRRAIGRVFVVVGGLIERLRFGLLVRSP